MTILPLSRIIQSFLIVKLIKNTSDLGNKLFKDSGINRLLKQRYQRRSNFEKQYLTSETYDLKMVMPKTQSSYQR